MHTTPCVCVQLSWIKTLIVRHTDSGLLGHLRNRRAGGNGRLVPLDLFSWSQLESSLLNLFRNDAFVYVRNKFNGLDFGLQLLYLFHIVLLHTRWVLSLFYLQSNVVYLRCAVRWLRWWKPGSIGSHEVQWFPTTYSHSVLISDTHTRERYCFARPSINVTS